MASPSPASHADHSTAERLKRDLGLTSTLLWIVGVLMLLLGLIAPLSSSSLGWFSAVIMILIGAATIYAARGVRRAQRGAALVGLAAMLAAAAVPLAHGNLRSPMIFGALAVLVGVQWRRLSSDRGSGV